MNKKNVKKSTEKRQIRGTPQGIDQFLHVDQLWGVDKYHFVNLKYNSALLYNKGHNLLTSAFPKNLLN